jgi:hypothetical protein
MTRGLRRLANGCWLSFLLSAVIVLDGRMAPALLALVPAALFAAPLLLPAFEPPRWLTNVSLAIFLSACGWTVYHQPGAPLDLFEDGLLLAPAQAYRLGARPYLDTYPLHGWGADGGLDALAFGIFEPTLATFRLRRAALTALALPCLAACSLLFFGDGRWAGIGLLFSLCLCPFVSERQLLALAATCILLLAARTGRTAHWICAGALSGVAVFFSLDFGLIVLSGGLAAAILLPCLDGGLRLRPGLSRALAFGAGAAAGSLPFLWRLQSHGALPAFFQVSFVDIPATITDTWGLPAGSASAIASTIRPGTLLGLLAPGSEMPSLSLVLLLATGTTMLLFRAARGCLEPVDRAAAVGLAVAAAALRGTLGRADAGHLALYGIFAGLPSAWILYRATHARRYRLLLSGAALAVLLVRLNPYRTLVLEWHAIEGGSRARAAAALDPHILRSGRATVPAREAREIAALQSVLDALPLGQTFFDFANEPALYFVFDRKPPVRYDCVPYYETEDKQSEVIAALEEEKPPLALLGNGTGHDAFDGISSRDRAPRVAAYLDAHYEPLTEIFGRRIVRRRVP